MSVIVYRMTLRSTLTRSEVVEESSLITSITGAMLNLICILLLNQIYSKVALFLTELELPRTQTEFDNSLTLKMYFIQFVNYYSSIFYIAFFKVSQRHLSMWSYIQISY